MAFVLPRLIGLLLAVVLSVAGNTAAAQAPTWQLLTAVNQINSSHCTVTAVDAEDFQTLCIVGDFEGTVRFGATQLTSAGGVDGFVARWNHVTNTFTWALRFGGAADEHASGIDVNGYSAYVVGRFRSPAAAFGFRTLPQTGGPGTSDAFVAKIADTNSSAAYFQWAYALTGTADEQATCVSVDGGSVLVGGSFSSAAATLGALQLTNASAGGHTDGFVTLLYDNGTTGSFMWAWPVAGPDNETVTAVLSGGFYAGEFTSASLTTGPTTLTHSSGGTGRDLFVGALQITYNSVSTRWAYRAGGPGDDQLTAANRGAFGWYITGAFTGATLALGPFTLTNANPAGTTTDAFVAQVADAGTAASFLWAYPAGGAGNDVGRAVSFGVGANPGVLYLAGEYEGTAGFGPHRLASAGPVGTSDIFVARLNDARTSATYAWAQRAGGPGDDQALAVLPSFQNRLLVAGTATPPAQFSALPLPGTAQTGVGYLGLLLDVAPLAAAVTGDTLVCAGGQVVLTATGSAAVQSYRWNTGATTAAITVAQPGVYTVTITFGTGETRTAQRRVSAFTPTLHITGDSVVCAGTAVSLLGLAPGATAFHWSTGATAPSAAVSQPGTYTLTALFGSGCALTRRVVVRAAALAITGPSTLCAGSSAGLVAVAPGARSYRWSTGDTTATLAIQQAGTYAVAATFPSGCTLSQTQRITPTGASIRGDSVGCAAQPVHLHATQPGALSYRWNTGATDSTLAVTTTGTFSVVVQFAGGCQHSASWRVRIMPALPSVSLGADTTVCEGSEVLLGPVGASALPAGLTYQWSTGETTPTILVQQAGTYTLQLQSLCGTRTASTRVAYRPCLTIPNVITPNGDTHNDQFKIVGMKGSWNLRLYNRWGQQVYYSSAYANDWGADAIAGTYYYLLYQAGNALVYKGWVEVIR